MVNDIHQATLLVLAFLVALGLLIFGMDWLEDRIDAPPSRLNRWLRARRQSGRPHGIQPTLPEAPPAVPQQRSPEIAELPLANRIRKTDQAAGSTSTPESRGW